MLGAQRHEVVVVDGGRHEAVLLPVPGMVGPATRLWEASRKHVWNHHKKMVTSY